MLKKNRYELGQRVFEVLLYKVRPAVITEVKRIRLDDPARTRVYVYCILCDDGSPSPRYYESDFGKVLFTDRESAEACLAENLAFQSTLGGRPQGITDSEVLQ